MHLGSREGRAPFAKVKSAERRTLLPEPPVGQLSDQEIMSADMSGLKRIAEGRGLNAEELFNPERWSRMGNARELAISPFWTRENNIRFALLQMDGRSAAELMSIFKITEPAAQGRMTSMRKWLREEYRDIPGAARMTRKWHELLSPPDAESEKMLRELQRRCAHIPRDQMFVHPRDRTGNSSERQNGGRSMSERTMLDYDVVIQVLHMRFIQKKSPQEIVASLDPELGPRTIRDLDALYPRVLTYDARVLFGMEVHKPWMLKEYRTAAEMFIQNEAIPYADIAKALKRQKAATMQGIRQAGLRLIAEQPKYQGEHFLVAFLLEYGPPHLFPENEDRRVVAERIQKLHALDDSSPIAPVNRTKKEDAA
ncbi:hypothetical protein K2Y00_00205 [Patescibacteria group bacterium]|nr:hypothetical protein [Patescibacteria group bacterium]